MTGGSILHGRCDGSVIATSVEFEVEVECDPDNHDRNPRTAVYGALVTLPEGYVARTPTGQQIDVYGDVFVRLEWDEARTSCALHYVGADTLEVFVGLQVYAQPDEDEEAAEEELAGEITQRDLDLWVTDAVTMACQEREYETGFEMLTAARFLVARTADMNVHATKLGFSLNKDRDRREVVIGELLTETEEAFGALAKLVPARPLRDGDLQPVALSEAVAILIDRVNFAPLLEGDGSRKIRHVIGSWSGIYGWLEQIEEVRAAARGEGTP